MSTESKRQQRFAGVIQQDLAQLFLREGSHWAPGAFVTVTQVRVTPDLAIARVYLSFLDFAKSQAAIDSIRSKASEIRYLLGTKIKNQARIVPHLEFFIDDTNEYVAHMDKIFNQINKDPEEND